MPCRQPVLHANEAVAHRALATVLAAALPSATLLALGASCAAASAQVTPAAPAGATLDEVQVSAERDRSYGTERTQIGTFRDQRIVEIPLTVNVVPKQVIEAQHATTI